MNPKESGIAIVSIGMSVFAIGMLLLMDRALMISGNLLIVVGLALLLRSKSLALLSIDRIHGVVLFVMGIMFLVYGFSVFGFVLEVAGLFAMLKDSIPTFRSVLRNLLFSRLPMLMSKK
ncbi:hypothetical protein HK407_05g09270 [Ordospora pajunii]|jgi:hypothetical protein|uniref:uncharacterized protein n=1 Tax=Ordospora pajunii TaxID=3039483 RepID=UPI0029528BBE|nr:uncharacterized protein HK407_05g09270 [Ordospora pajunii]KAH9411409.1 hypothetical protein HK407_05g09270 [Ordospora pajunii]